MLPTHFFYQGQVLELPIEQGETEARWLERLVYLFETYDPRVPLRIASVRAHQVLNHLFFGVNYDQ